MCDKRFRAERHSRCPMIRIATGVPDCRRREKQQPLAPPSSDSGRGPEPQAQRGGGRRPRSRQRRFCWSPNPDMSSRAPPSCSAMAHTTRTSAGDAPVGKRHFRGIALQKRNVHTCGPLVASICQTSPKTEREYCRTKTSPAEHYFIRLYPLDAVCKSVGLK